MRSGTCDGDPRESRGIDATLPTLEVFKTLKFLSSLVLESLFLDFSICLHCHTFSLACSVIYLSTRTFETISTCCPIHTHNLIMQYSSTLTFITSLMAMATLIHAQTIQQELAKIPACGMICLTTASTAAGCGATDFNCTFAIYHFPLLRTQFSNLYASHKVFLFLKNGSQGLNISCALLVYHTVCEQTNEKTPKHRSMRIWS